MRKLYLIDTQDYRFLMSDDGELRRVLTDDKDPSMIDADPIEYLNAVEDDSSWEMCEETAAELIEGQEVLAEIEVEW